MITFEKHAPSFCGKNAIEKLYAWNALMYNNDFTSLLSDFQGELVEYITNLRKAEIFDECEHATAMLTKLKEHIDWKEYYSLDYAVRTSLTYHCEDENDFIAHLSGKSGKKEDWFVRQFCETGGGNSLDWEVGDRWSDEYPGEIHVFSLTLVDAENKHKNSVPSVTLG